MPPKVYPVSEACRPPLSTERGKPRVACYFCEEVERRCCMRQDPRQGVLLSPTAADGCSGLAGSRHYRNCHRLVGWSIGTEGLPFTPTPNSHTREEKAGSSPLDL